MPLRNHCWAFAKIDPMDLFQKLLEAFGVPPTQDPLKSASDAPMPDLGSPNFRDLYLLKEVVRKSPDLPLGIDTRNEALKSFFEDEAFNASTNDRLNSLYLDNPGVSSIVEMAARKIGEILGRFDEDAFWSFWRFGPKSTLSLPRAYASVYNKLTLAEPKINARALGLAKELLSRNPTWAYSLSGDGRGAYSPSDTVPPVPYKLVDLDSVLRVCEWDRWTSVTKNAKTDRGICIPADIAVVLQLSVGHQIRSRLYSAGVNLNDQSINQRLAYEASMSGTSATVDVRGASQAVTCGLVYKLIGRMPSQYTDPRWYLVLDALRAPFTMVDGELHENEMFSAMGNGYTFELESLIFYSIAVSCCESLGIPPAVSVYGDDIILPSEVVPLLEEVFAYCGFRLNMSKSFWNTTGPKFRESCGKHFLDGRDVTPFYVDTSLDNPASIVLLANNIMRWASSSGTHRDGRLYPVWLWVVAHLSDDYLSRGIPMSEANDGLILDWDEALPRPVYLNSAPTRRAPKRTFVGWKAKTVDYTSRPKQSDDESRYLTWLYNTSHGGFKPPRPSVGTYVWAPIRRGTYVHGGEEVQRTSLTRVWLDFESLVKPPPPKVVGEKKSVITGMRVEAHWTCLGPWLLDTDEPCIGLNWRDAVTLVRGRNSLPERPNA